MKKYFLIFIAALTFSSASCSLVEPSTGGVLRTANGGVDWQGSNAVKGDPKAQINGLSVTKLEFDPQKPENVYASASNAGLYKSSDGGGSWEQVLSTLPVLDFAINPVDSNIIYVGGNFDKKARALATRDGGKSWNEVFNEGISSTAVRAVAINPANPQEVALGLSHGGVVMSADGGSTWRQLQTYKDRVQKIIWRRDGIYILIRNAGMYKSSDGGNSFVHLTANIRSASNPSQSRGSSISQYHTMDVSLQDPNTIFLATNAGLYRSDNGGQGWGFVSMPLKQKSLQPISIAIAPSSGSVVYVGAGSSIYKTTDGGITWLTSDTGTKNLINTILVNPELPQVAFAGVTLK